MKLTEIMRRRIKCSGHFGGLVGRDFRTDPALRRRGLIEEGPVGLLLTAAGRKVKEEIAAAEGMDSPASDRLERSPNDHR